MSDFSDYMENTIINHMLRNQAWTPPSVIYVACFTASTGLETNNPTSEVSFSGTGYSRKSVTLSAPSGGSTSNNAAVQFDQATSNWGTITHFAIVDHASNTNWGTGVNVMMWNALASSKTINTGDILRFDTGAITVTVQ